MDSDLFSLDSDSDLRHSESSLQMSPVLTTCYYVTKQSRNWNHWNLYLRLSQMDHLHQIRIRSNRIVPVVFRNFLFIWPDQNIITLFFLLSRSFVSRFRFNFVVTLFLGAWSLSHWLLWILCRLFSWFFFSSFILLVFLSRFLLLISGQHSKWKTHFEHFSVEDSDFIIS